MKEKLATTDIKREVGYLYYMGTDANGFLTINKTLMKRGGRKKGSTGKMKVKKAKK